MDYKVIIKIMDSPVIVEYDYVDENDAYMIDVGISFFNDNAMIESVKVVNAYGTRVFYIDSDGVNRERVLMEDEVGI